MYQKKREAEFFHVKTISKDVRKTIVPPFMFLFNSFEACRSLCKENKNIMQCSPLNQKNKNTRDFLVRSLCYIESESYRGVRVRSHASYAEACLD